MGRWKLWFILLLPLTFYVNSKETGQLLVKTIGNKPDVTPICNNATLQTIIRIDCKIRTKKNKGEECSLLYQGGRDYVHKCDSRFTLVKNQIVFLHLTSLTPVDSGNYTCECSRTDGTDILHLNINVEEDEDPSKMQIPRALVGVTVVTLLIGVIIWLIHRTKSNGGCSRSAISGLSACEAPCSLDQDDPDDPYTSLQRPDSDLYQSISNLAGNRVTICLENQETDGGETGPDWEIYQNI